MAACSGGGGCGWACGGGGGGPHEAESERFLRTFHVTWGVTSIGVTLIGVTLASHGRHIGV
eukprot:2438760-Prymnesium_polylepis.1